MAQDNEQVVLGVRLPLALKRELDADAQRLGLKTSEVVRLRLRQPTKLPEEVHS